MATRSRASERGGGRNSRDGNEPVAPCILAEWFRMAALRFVRHEDDGSRLAVRTKLIRPCAHLSQAFLCADRGQNGSDSRQAMAGSRGKGLTDFYRAPIHGGKGPRARTPVPVPRYFSA